MNMSLFEENIETLRNVSKWVDTRLVLMTAAQLTAKNILINENDFKHIADSVKKSASVFSPLKTIYFSISGFIYAKDNQVEDELLRIHHHFKNLKAAGFRSSIHTYIAAMLMDEGLDVNRIKDIYNGMRKFHRFLTSYDDYPAAVIIAKQSPNVEELLANCEKYYVALHEKGLYRGNDLQLLGNMLVMNGAFSMDTVNKVIRTKEAFEHSRIKIQSIHYSSLGIIALSNKMNEALSLTHELVSMKELKWHKNMAVIIASIFVSQDYSDTVAGLTSAVEVMIQAQQSAVIAATAASIAASSSSSGGQ